MHRNSHSRKPYLRPRTLLTLTQKAQKMPGPTEIPFTHYPYPAVPARKYLVQKYMPRNRHEDFDWEQNLSFDATLRVERKWGKNLEVVNEETNTSYWMLPEYLIELVMQERLVGATITGTWRVTKKGISYFVELDED